MSVIDAAPVLELKDLSKAFGGLRAVRGVSLTIMPGDRKAIIGPNGAGKTTLFNLITGILPASSGRAGHGAHVPSHQPVPEAVGARQRAAGDQGPARLEIRDVAISVFLSRRL
jgi:ABC-type branched-subunit amino acid transport system ATPase component